ncbi:Doubled CXXCH motif (Paired_CXXCH_1) [uncultured archaeon]|nr:Doubled CXXCH motif (Paired_CXXCH_1) [uncultured archaeon]
MFLITKKQKTLMRLSFSCMILLFSALAAGANPGTLNNSCVDCHKTISPFTDEQLRLNEIRLNHTLRNISCSLECHEDVIRKTASDNYQQWSDSDHSKYYVTCDKCHGGNPDVKNESESHASMQGINNESSPIYFKNIPDTCGNCHTEEMKHFKDTMHYQRLQAESRAPSCVTCHKPHSFKVLKASEMTALCSVCHNPKDQVATATVPIDAKNALVKQKEFQDELMNAKNAVATDKAARKDVTSAQADLDNAQAVMDNIPSLWHQFNLKDFDSQVQKGIDYAKKAESKTSTIEPTVPRIPGFEIILVFAIIPVSYLMRKSR